MREACFNCSFKTKEQYSDIILGDFWAIEQIYPGIDDNKGISAIFINSEKGEKLFGSIKEKLDCFPVDLSEASRCNSVLFKASAKPRERDGFLKEVYEIGFKHIKKKFFKQPVYLGIKRKAKAVLQYIKH